MVPRAGAVAVARGGGGHDSRWGCQTTCSISAAGWVLRRAFTPSRQDAVEEVARLCADGADVALEMSGSAVAVRQGLECLRPGGRFSAFGLTNGPVEVDLTNQVVFKGARIRHHRADHVGHLVSDGRAAAFRRARLRAHRDHRLPFDQWQHAFDLLLAPDRRG